MAFLNKWKGILTRIIVGLITATTLMVLYVLCWIRVKLTARIYYYKNKSLLSREDVLPIPDIDNFEAFINALLLTRGNFSLDDMKQLFLSKVLNAKDLSNRPQFPRFTQYFHICAGYLMWNEDVKFNIDDHIRLFRGQPPNDEEQLKTLITNLCHKNVPILKPRWEIIVIPLEYSQSDLPKTCILFRIHHCIADGTSISRLIFEQMAGNHGALQQMLKRAQMKFKPKFDNGFVNMFVNVTRVVYKYILQHSSIPPKRNSQVFMKDDRELSGTRYLDWTSAIKLDTIRRIRNATSATVNDVLTACMGGAFRKYFLKHDLCPPDFLASGSAFTFHDPDDPVQLRNKGYPMVVSIPTGDLDCLQRLKATKFGMDQTKRSPDIFINRLFLQYWCNTIPYTTISRMVDQEFINVIVSNIAGSSSKVAFNGNTIESWAMMAFPNRHIGFTVGFLTYAGDVTVTVTVDKARVSSREDLAQLLHDFVEEVEQLHDLVVGSPDKPPSTAMENKVD